VWKRETRSNLRLRLEFRPGELVDSVSVLQTTMAEIVQWNQLKEAIRAGNVVTVQTLLAQHPNLIHGHDTDVRPPQLTRV
jgi:hypothetical protein